MSKKLFYIISFLYLLSFPVKVLAQLADTPWPKFHHDLRNTGKTSNFGTQVGKLKWKVVTNGPVTSSPALDDKGFVYIGSADNYFYVIDAETGEVYCKAKTGGAIEHSSPAIDKNGIVYIGSNDGKLYAFNTDNVENRELTVEWTFPTDGAITSSPSINNDGNIIFASNDGYTYAVTPGGTLDWKRYIGASWCSPAIDTTLNQVYIGSWKTQASTFSFYEYTFDNQTIILASSVNFFALSSSTGSIVWDFPGYTIEFCVPGGVLSSPVIAPDGSIIVSYFISFDNDDPCDAKVWKYNVFNVDSSTGWALWRLNLESDADIYGTPAMLEDNSIFVPAKSNLHRILPDMTSYLAVQGDGQRIESSPAIDGGKLIFVGSNGGRFYCLCADCPETPILWKYPTTDEPLQTVNVGGTVSTASIISSPAIGDDTHHSVYVGASDGNVYAFYDGIKIYGTVKDNSGQPIPAVKISISSEVLKDNRETFTDPEGKYEFAGVENDTYTVTPDKTLYYFEPDSNEEIIYNDMEINFTGYLGYSISGYVRDSEGNGKPNVTVSITGINDFEDDTTTDSDGMFELQGLRAGTYTLTPSLKGYEFTPDSYPVTITTEDKELGDKFTISEPDDDSVNLSISGYMDVSGLDNATIAEIRVELLDENNQEIDDFPPVTLDNSGLFLFPGVDNNKMYIIKPVLKGYCFEPASQTETVSGRDITDITFLIIEGFSITGKVTNFRGIGVEGVNLAVEDDESLNTETNEDGTYTFTGLEAGKYTVTIDQEGYTSLPKSREANIAQKNIEYINFFVYPTCPDVFVNIPFIGSEGTLVNIFGTNFGWEEPEEEVTYSIGDTGVTLEGGVYFGTEDPETWVKADVVSWINFKIVAEAPEGFGIFSVWVVNETACNYTSAMSTNLFILLP